MIARYLVLSERMRTELEKIEQVVDHAEGAVSRAGQQPEDEDYFMAAAALDLHSFYAGVERLLALIATEIDGGLPKGPRWHRDLLEQMTLKVRGVRPAVLQPETQIALINYLEFRHVVRNVYTFDLRPGRLQELVTGLRIAFELTQRDLLVFVKFLDSLADADEDA